MTKTRSVKPNARNGATNVRKASLQDTLRAWGDMLSLWRLCDQKGCRRGRACRGNVRACVGRNFPLLPEGERDWFAGLAEAQEEQMPFDEAMEWLDTTPAGEAFHAWHTAVEASLRPPLRRR